MSLLLTHKPGNSSIKLINAVLIPPTNVTSITFALILRKCSHSKHGKTKSSTCELKGDGWGKEGCRLKKDFILIFSGFPDRVAQAINQYQESRRAKGPHSHHVHTPKGVGVRAQKVPLASVTFTQLQTRTANWLALKSCSQTIPWECQGRKYRTGCNWQIRNQVCSS